MKILLLAILFLLFTITCRADVNQFYKISKEKWEKEYESGNWNYMDKESIERSRTAIVAVFASYSKNQGIILDIGCGEGILYDYLDSRIRGNYTGIDISSKAIDIAKSKRKVNAFAVTAEDFDMAYLHSRGIALEATGVEVVIFNEVLYYLDHVKIMQKFASMMNKGGIVIISNWFTSTVKYSNTILETIFADASKIFNLEDEITVSGPKGKKSLFSAKIGMFSLKS